MYEVGGQPLKPRTIVSIEAAQKSATAAEQRARAGADLRGISPQVSGGYRAFI